MSRFLARIPALGRPYMPRLILMYIHPLWTMSLRLYFTMISSGEMYNLIFMYLAVGNGVLR